QGPQGPQGPAGPGYTNGSNMNDIMFWNGMEWVPLQAPPPSGTYVLKVVDGMLQWVLE
ncbi:MAG: hypothetical protein GX140_01875, partial [Bacteroidales bacterium]|nr:hypothetical protein [Bacteroidales bacterium]